MSTGRPPSVDALARHMAPSGLPHAVLVELAREAIAAGPPHHDPDRALARAIDHRRTLLSGVVNATGVLLHTNLGRAPMAMHHPDRKSTRLNSSHMSESRMPSSA